MALIKKAKLEKDLLAGNPAPQIAGTIPVTNADMLKWIKLLRKFLKKTAAKGKKKGDELLEEVEEVLKRRLAYAQRVANLRIALKRLNRVKGPRPLDLKAPNKLLGPAPDRPPWKPLYDGDAFSGTRGTGGIQAMRAFETPQGGVQLEVAGDLLPSIAPVRKRLRHPDGTHKPIDFSHELGEAGTRRYGGKPLVDAKGKVYERAHLWGHGFGDEARAGIMYAPSAVNQAFQRVKIENFLIEQAAIAEKLGGKVTVAAKARSHPLTKAGSNLKDAKGEMVLSELSYDIFITRPDGSKFNARYELTISKPPGSRIEESIDPVDLLAAGV